MANYQGKHVAKRSRRIPLSVWLAYLLVASLIATGVTFSGYVTQAHGADSARVAVMASNVTTIVSGKIVPGETLNFDFTVANYEEDLVCEVAQKYTIESIRLLSNLPVNGEDQENLTDITFSIQEKKGENQYESITLPYEGTFAAGEKFSKSFRVTASWPDAAFTEEMSFEIDAIEITVNAEQLD